MQQGLLVENILLVSFWREFINYVTHIFKYFLFNVPRCQFFYLGSFVLLACIVSQSVTSFIDTPIVLTLTPLPAPPIATSSKSNQSICKERKVRLNSTRTRNQILNIIFIFHRHFDF